MLTKLFFARSCLTMLTSWCSGMQIVSSSVFTSSVQHSILPFFLIVFIIAHSSLPGKKVSCNLHFLPGDFGWLELGHAEKFLLLLLRHHWYRCSCVQLHGHCHSIDLDIHHDRWCFVLFQGIQGSAEVNCCACAPAPDVFSFLLADFWEGHTLVRCPSCCTYSRHTPWTDSWLPHDQVPHMHCVLWGVFPHLDVFSFLLADFWEWHTLARCPFLLHLPHTYSANWQLAATWSGPPQWKHSHMHCVLWGVFPHLWDCECIFRHLSWDSCFSIVMLLQHWVITTQGLGVQLSCLQTLANRLCLRLALVLRAISSDETHFWAHIPPSRTPTRNPQTHRGLPFSQFGKVSRHWLIFLLLPLMKLKPGCCH